MTLMAAAITAVICVVVSVLITTGVRGRAADYKRERATEAALEVVALLKRERLPRTLRPRGVSALQVIDPQGRVLADSGGLGDRPVASFQPPPDRVYDQRLLCPPTGLDGCMNVIAFRVYEPDGDWTVYVADRAIPWYVSGPLCVFLISIGLLVTLLVSLRTWRTVDQTLAPVDAIRAELTEITATKSGRRVPVPETRDEIRLLAEAANATLDRLDAALERQRRFTSDASHDLRSPITAARAQLEEALLYPDDVDWPQTGRSVLQSLDRLQAIVTDLLELARLDAEAWTGEESVDLAALASIELARADRSKRIVTHVQENVTVRGDRLKLVRLFTNLLDNAERHADSRIDITVRAEGDTAVLEVADDGVGVSPGDREMVFQRFARLREGRERDANGTGLGLPIARQIAEAHGGGLTIEDSPRGARFVLSIPRNNGADH
ncbi:MULTISPECIES: sensor histidine kinase [Thermomonosporaceae]|uniref:sensor histidine kinase n=1 Tax=Thermomonosporaceae TaxID=2012 RepID=UPI00255B213F|nr:MULTISPECIES: HAMP domain-containing sensor histidine kinase [Thermomonosporaceae]MDL4773131.1 HAMP domain-containing sensor histidine kinase [Actinomadura xylanilytica]